MVAAGGAFASIADADAQHATEPPHVDAQGTHHDANAHVENCTFCRHLTTAQPPAPHGGHFSPGLAYAGQLFSSASHLSTRAPTSIERPRPPPAQLHQA
jgi:hypothetical protein